MDRLDEATTRRLMLMRVREWDERVEGVQVQDFKEGYAHSTDPSIPAEFWLEHG